MLLEVLSGLSFSTENLRGQSYNLMTELPIWLAFTMDARHLFTILSHWPTTSIALLIVPIYLLELSIANFCEIFL